MAIAIAISFGLLVGDWCDDHPAVSVTERTKEIGVRKPYVASQDIVRQFCLRRYLTFLGGIGVWFGVG